MNTTPTPPQAAEAARAVKPTNQRALPGPPNHRAILKAAAHQSSPFRIRTAPMPDATKEDAS